MDKPLWFDHSYFFSNFTSLVPTSNLVQDQEEGTLLQIESLLVMIEEGTLFPKFWKIALHYIWTSNLVSSNVFIYSMLDHVQRKLFLSHIKLLTGTSKRPKSLKRHVTVADTDQAVVNCRSYNGS